MIDEGTGQGARRRHTGGQTASRAVDRSVGRMASGLALALAMTGPTAARADPDGRAEWRRPAPPPPSVSGPAPEAADEPPLGRAVEATPAPANAPPTLGPIGAQELVIGRRWQLHLRARDADGEPPRLLVRGLPGGARVEPRGKGWHLLEWTPPANAPGSLELTIVAVDARDSRLRSERVLRLVIVPPSGAPASASLPSVPELSSARPSETPTVSPDPPRIEPLAGQVVSAGRTVVKRVRAALASGGTPLLWIDRLPSNASFDENPDGSRTFHWPTSEADQGEHRFRITVQHPTRAELVSHAELLVIVGDPTRSRTLPDDEMTTEAFPLDELPALAPPAFDDPAPPEEPFDPSPENEPFLPSGETGTFATEALYGDGSLPEGALEDSTIQYEEVYFESEDPYFEDGALEFDPESGTFLQSPSDGALAPSPEAPGYFADDGMEPVPGYGN